MLGTARYAGVIDNVIRLRWSCSCIERDEGRGEMEPFPEGITGEKCLVGIDCVESGVAKEYFRKYQRMLAKEILQSRKQKTVITDGLIFVRRAGLLLADDFRMCRKKGFIIEIDCPWDTQTIGDNACFVGIAEVPVHVLLLDLGLSFCMGRHTIVSGFVGIKGMIKAIGLGESGETTNHGVEILRIVFSDPGLNAGGIIDCHVCQFGTDLLTDWFGEINKTIKDDLKILTEPLLKSSDLRGIRNLIKATELAEMRRVVQKSKKHGIRWNGENALND